MDMHTSTRLLYPILVLAGVLVIVLSLFSVSTTAGELTQNSSRENVVDKQSQSTLSAGLDMRYGELTNEQRRQVVAAQQHTTKSRKCNDCGTASTQRAGDSLWR
ncbi:MAG: hypothetical protein WC426_02065 [Sulfuriferula sp.]